MKNYKLLLTIIATILIASCSSDTAEEYEVLQEKSNAKSKSLASIIPCFTPEFTSPTTVEYDCTPTIGASYANSIKLNFGTIGPTAPITMIVEIQEYVQDCDSNAPDEPTTLYFGELHRFEYTPAEYSGNSLTIGNTSAFGMIFMPDVFTERCFAWRVGFERYIDGEKCEGFKAWHFETFKTHCD